MKRLLRWLGIGVLSVLALALIALVVIYVIAEVKLRHRYAVPADTISTPADSLSIAEGFRLARLRGCAGGCHGDNIEGGMFIDEWWLARLPAANLTVAVQDYSDTELVGIIRHGVRPDGRSVIGMPSDMFRPLNDADLGRILAYLRSVPPTTGQARGVSVGPMGRLGVVMGMYKPAAEDVRRAEELIGTFPAESDSLTEGAYLARTVCTECHGLDLTGGPEGYPPDLRIVAGYSLEAFTHLMRTGKGLGQRDLKLMSEVARERFVHFTDAEIGELYRYLIDRANQPVTDSQAE
jgi:mono/diheme cytochrome c family protein